MDSGTSDDLAETISAGYSNACDAYLTVDSQFLNNRETHAPLFEAKFCNFVQGDLSLVENTKELKRMADMLADLGEVINDRTLVLHLIRGFNERFKNVGMLLCCGRPFPSFADAKADLIEELNMEHQVSPQLTALVASTAMSASSTSRQQPASRSTRQ